MISRNYNFKEITINDIIKNTKYTKKKMLENDQVVKNIATLETGKPNEISFFENKKYLNYLNSTKVSYCFIKERDLAFLNNSSVIPIISDFPLLDFILTVKIFYPNSDKDTNEIDASSDFQFLKNKNTLIDKSVKIGKNFNAGYNTLIKKNVLIGDNVVIGSNCSLSNVVVGNNVTINDGSVIGKIGYGFKRIDNKMHFIPHVGIVNINNNVYIGSNCTIDRGSFSNTIIGESTMIDNQVHIAHNVKIGKNCYLAAQSGIAGSAKIGDNCMIGGQAGISGHLNIGNNVHIGGKSGVITDIENNIKVMGYPATNLKTFLRNKIKKDDK